MYPATNDVCTPHSLLSHWISRIITQVITRKIIETDNKTLTEGIKQAEEKDQLILHGIDLMQGYYFS